MQLCSAPRCGALLRQQPIGARRSRPARRMPLAVHSSLLTDVLVQVCSRAGVGGLACCPEASGPRQHRVINYGLAMQLPCDVDRGWGGLRRCRRRPPAAAPCTSRAPPSAAAPTSQGALSFEAAPPEALLAGGAITLLALAGIGYAVAQQAGPSDRPAAAREPEIPREDAVLVFGATGRTGRTIVNSVCCLLGLLAPAGLGWAWRLPWCLPCARIPLLRLPCLVPQLLEQGRTVVAAVRSPERAAEVLGKAGPTTGTVALRAGARGAGGAPSGGILFIESVRGCG